MGKEKATQLKIEYVDIAKIKPNEYNPKKLSEKEAKDLEQSIVKFGIVDPLIINKAENRNNIIIGGHQRWKVYKKMGLKEVPVVKLNIPDLEGEKEICLRLSKNTGEFDWNLLAGFDESMLSGIGFDSEELDKIFDLRAEEDDFDAQIEYEKIKEPKVKLGDLYQLGSHRLLCGNSAKKENAERLMGGEKADMVFTDPPYNVDYESETLGKIKGDKMNENDFIQFSLSFVGNISLSLKRGGVYYICSGYASYPAFLYSIKARDMKFSAPIIWVKNYKSFKSFADYKTLKTFIIFYPYYWS